MGLPCAFLLFLCSTKLVRFTDSLDFYRYFLLTELDEVVGRLRSPSDIRRQGISSRSQNNSKSFSASFPSSSPVRSASVWLRLRVCSESSILSVVPRIGIRGLRVVFLLLIRLDLVFEGRESEHRSGQIAHVPVGVAPPGILL